MAGLFCLFRTEKIKTCNGHILCSVGKSKLLPPYYILQGLSQTLKSNLRSRNCSLNHYSLESDLTSNTAKLDIYPTRYNEWSRF
ncbi:hypothetical protein DENIT_12742 [Pseudomonas veronii]|nr:hypothetical protein DENIT_12742 [Pseudomonas veronii]